MHLTGVKSQKLFSSTMGWKNVIHIFSRLRFWFSVKLWMLDNMPPMFKNTQALQNNKERVLHSEKYSSQCFCARLHHPVVFSQQWFTLWQILFCKLPKYCNINSTQTFYRGNFWNHFRDHYRDKFEHNFMNNFETVFFYYHYIWLSPGNLK